MPEGVLQLDHQQGPYFETVRGSRIERQRIHSNGIAIRIVQFNEMPAPLLTACRSWVSTRAALPFAVTFHKLAAGKSSACIGAVHTLFRPGAKKAVPSGLRVLLNCSL